MGESQELLGELIAGVVDLMLLAEDAGEHELATSLHATMTTLWEKYRDVPWVKGARYEEA